MVSGGGVSEGGLTYHICGTTDGEIGGGSIVQCSLTSDCRSPYCLCVSSKVGSNSIRGGRVPDDEVSDVSKSSKEG